MGLKVGRVPQGGLNITFKLKKSQPSTYECHKGIMKIAPKTVFCRDFAELLFSNPASTKPASFIILDRSMEIPQNFPET